MQALLEYWAVVENFRYVPHCQTRCNALTCPAAPDIELKHQLCCFRRLALTRFLGAKGKSYEDTTNSGKLNERRDRDKVNIPWRIQIALSQPEGPIVRRRQSRVRCQVKAVSSLNIVGVRHSRRPATVPRHGTARRSANGRRTIDEVVGECTGQRYHLVRASLPASLRVYRSVITER